MTENKNIKIIIYYTNKVLNKDVQSIFTAYFLLLGVHFCLTRMGIEATNFSLTDILNY